MAVQRLTLAQIETEILRITGYSASTAAPWLTSANLYLRINSYIQALPVKLAQLVGNLRETGKMPPASGVPRFDMWRTEGTLPTKAGVRTVSLPADYDHWIALWNNTSNDAVDVVENVTKYHHRLKKQVPGVVEAIEIMGYPEVDGAAKPQKYANVYPIPSVDQPIAITYWRLPRAMAGTSTSNEFPDIDPKYEQLSVYGPVVELMRPTGPDFERYLSIEQNLLRDVALTARSI